MTVTQLEREEEQFGEGHGYEMGWCEYCLADVLQTAMQSRAGEHAGSASVWQSARDVCVLVCALDLWWCSPAAAAI